MEKEYIVTLRNRGDLEKFYDDMENSGGPEFVPDREVEVVHKRPISRNTHYLLTEEEAETLKNDERVWNVAEPIPESVVTSYGSRSYTAVFTKAAGTNPDTGVDGSSGTLPSWPISSTDEINWGILHCTGDNTQRRKDTWGIGDISLTVDMTTLYGTLSVGDLIFFFPHGATGTTASGYIKSFNTSTGIMVIRNPSSSADWVINPSGNSTIQNSPFSGQIKATSVTPTPLKVTDNVTIFNNGENVDVVICDSPVAKDHDEYLDPDTGSTRFVEYQWNEKHADDVLGYSQGSAWWLSNYPINYTTDNYLASVGDSHGTHVAGTTTGRTHGWANKSNVYSMCLITSNVSGSGWKPFQTTSAGTQWDYLRAFHKDKPLNPVTGKRNPTVTNHSYGSPISFTLSSTASSLTTSQLPKIRFRGVVYNNPNDGTWTESFLLENFGLYLIPHRNNTGAITHWGHGDGFQNNQNGLSYNNQSQWPDSTGVYHHDEGKVDIIADVEDAIQDGVVVVCAAGNSSNIGYPVGHENYDNAAYIIGTNAYTGGSLNSWVFYHRANAMQNSPNMINTGNLSTSANNECNTSSCLGSNIYILAPGTNIESAYPNSSSTDQDEAITGTSMASPQVCGVLACLFTNMDAGDVNQARAMQYLEEFSLYDDVPNVHSLGNTHSLNFDCIGSLNGAPNRTLRAVDRRIIYKESDYGYILFNETPRNIPQVHTPKSGMIYPRKKVGRIRY